jgi:hypothetical protein
MAITGWREFPAFVGAAADGHWELCECGSGACGGPIRPGIVCGELSACGCGRVRRCAGGVGRGDRGRGLSPSAESVASACFGGASMWRYDTNDPATRIGYVIGDVFLVLFTAFMFWGLFFSR